MKPDVTFNGFIYIVTHKGAEYACSDLETAEALVKKLGNRLFK